MEPLVCATMDVNRVGGLTRSGHIVAGAAGVVDLERATAYEPPTLH